MAIGTASTYARLRFGTVGLLLLHIALRSALHTPTPLVDLYIYNAIAFLAAAIAFSAPPFNDHLARLSLGCAILLWAVGSTSTTWDSFYGNIIWPNFSDICYILFYPLMLFGLIRALTVHRTFRPIEILDVLIITFGFSTLIAALLLKTAMDHFVGTATSVFLSIVYPVGDVVLLSIALIVVMVQRRAVRSLLLLLGTAVFTATDLYFLYKSATTGYGFAQLTDDGWLIGLLLIAEALWHHGGETQVSERIIGFATTLATIFSGATLAYSALKPGTIPSTALVPAIATIALSIARLVFALREARSASTNFELARIDELTGLANRRTFIAHISALGTNPGTILLLDLDGFKAVNDSLGHEAGDQLLRQISLRFSRVIPSGALLARLGGDEFGVVIPGSSHLGHEVALALTSTTSYPFDVAGEEISVGVSIGRVINDGDSDLLQRADSAMYEAKRSGGGMVLWTP
jgi:diguanylate cyclase (GGDEF)-like protein